MECRNQHDALLTSMALSFRCQPDISTSQAATVVVALAVAFRAITLVIAMRDLHGIAQ